MTRLYAYCVCLAALVAATAMTIASISLPNWISYSVTTAKGETYDRHIGLHVSCSNLGDPGCQSYPPKDLCENGERYFCTMWRTVGFLSAFATILCLASLVGFVVIMSGGKYKRETSWPFASSMLALVSIVEFVTISLVAYLYDHDDQFVVPGWNLDVSWYLATLSAAISLITAGSLVGSAFLMRPEGDYEFLEDPVNP